MICVKVKDTLVIDHPYSDGLLHIPAAAGLDMKTVCGWDGVQCTEVEGVPTCEDCKQAVWHYRCLEIDP